MPRFLEQMLGAVFMLLILLDVFLTVLYARMEKGFVIRPVARGVWRLLRSVSRGFGQGRRSALTYGGPTTRDPHAGFEAYRSLRAQWDRHVATLANAMGYKLSDIDPIGVNPSLSDKLPPFGKRAA